MMTSEFLVLCSVPVCCFFFVTFPLLKTYMFNTTEEYGRKGLEKLNLETNIYIHSLRKRTPFAM